MTIGKTIAATPDFIQQKPNTIVQGAGMLGGLHDVVADPAYATATGLCLDSFETAGVEKSTKRRDTPAWWKKLRPTIESWF